MATRYPVQSPTMIDNWLQDMIQCTLYGKESTFDVKKSLSKDTGLGRILLTFQPWNVYETTPQPPWHFVGQPPPPRESFAHSFYASRSWSVGRTSIAAQQHRTIMPPHYATQQPLLMSPPIANAAYAMHSIPALPSTDIVPTRVSLLTLYSTIFHHPMYPPLTCSVAPSTIEN